MRHAREQPPAPHEEPGAEGARDGRRQPDRRRRLQTQSDDGKPSRPPV